MDPLLLLSLGGLVASSAGSLWTNYQNRALTEKTNDTQIQLANTQHQREVQDLLAAGLNPILSASGSGAAVPNLGVARMENVAEGAQSTARDVARIASGDYRASVEQKQLTNDYQRILNSAAESERSASAIEAQNAERRALLEQDALDHELGQYVDSQGKSVFDVKQYKRSLDLARQGIRAEMKNRSNANWRANLSAITGGASGFGSAASGVNSGAAAAMKLRWLLK